MKLKGRPKGARNKFTNLKDSFLKVFNLLQAKDPGARYNLEQWAKTNPGDFYKIVAKMLPSKLEADINAHEPIVIIKANKEDKPKIEQYRERLHELEQEEAQKLEKHPNRVLNYIEDTK